MSQFHHNNGWEKANERAQNGCRNSWLENMESLKYTEVALDNSKILSGQYEDEPMSASSFIHVRTKTHQRQHFFMVFDYKYPKTEEE